MAIIVRSRESLLTTSSGYTNYRGILNLVIILLVLSNARAALENIIKYGILVDPLSWFQFLGEGSKHWPALLIVFGLGINILISFVIEYINAISFVVDVINQSDQPTSIRNQNINKIINKNTGSILGLTTQIALVANLLACISLPPIFIYSFDTHPISTSASLMIVSIVFLKLVSYHMINFWCRDCRKPEELQSRTTKSFLRSYIPPEKEFVPIEPETSNDDEDDVVDDGDIIVGNDTKENERNVSINKLNSMGNQLRNRIINNTNNKNNTNDDNNNNDNDGDSSNKKHNQTPSLSKSKDDDAHQAVVESLSGYPKNITLRDICNFMIFPTLCYEIEYARIKRIRKRFLFKRIAELIVLSNLDLALIQQWIVPTVSNSVLPFRQMQLTHMLERLLKLAIPNHVIWLIWFYMFFHSLLNIIAELTRFADRQFYKDWWNSESVYYFWSNWNIPVHKWCARHLYVPLISIGLNKCQASTAVFFVSAFFHEYLVSVPLKLFRMWAFAGMLMQLPWARFVSSYFNNYLANVAVWVSLIIGQPLCILMYYHDYYVINSIKQALPSE